MIERPPVLKIKSTLRRPSEAQIAAFAGVPTGFVVDALGGGGALSSSIQQVGQGRDMISRAHGPALTADCGPADVIVSAFAGFQGLLSEELDFPFIGSKPPASSRSASA